MKFVLKLSNVDYGAGPNTSNYKCNDEERI
jgi:hypothetical protein